MRPEDEVPEEDGYIEEEEVRPVTTGLYCFIDSTRACGAECVAFVTHPRASRSTELNEQAAHCSLLLGVERMGRNLTVLAQVVSEGAKKRKLSDADRKRTEQFDPHRQGPVGSGPTHSPFPQGSKP